MLELSSEPSNTPLFSFLFQLLLQLIYCLTQAARESMHWDIDTAKIPHLAKAENSEPAESCPSCLPLQVLPVSLSQEAAAGGAAAAGQHEHFKQDEQPQQHQTQNHKNHYCNHRHCHKNKYRIALLGRLCYASVVNARLAVEMPLQQYVLQGHRQPWKSQLLMAECSNIAAISG